MDPKIRRRIKYFADQIVDDCLYFGYYELDDEDVTKIARKFKLDVQTICKTLRIDIPKELIKDVLK
jgi:hypothetical protein